MLQNKLSLKSVKEKQSKKIEFRKEKEKKSHSMKELRINLNQI